MCQYVVERVLHTSTICRRKKNEREKVSASSFFGRMEDSVFYDRRERTGKKSLLSLLS